jgi:hypothetical protein
MKSTEVTHKSSTVTLAALGGEGLISPKLIKELAECGIYFM